MRYLVVLLLAGCATTETVWDRPGASNADFRADMGYCRAQAFGVASGNLMQIAIVQRSCMEGKGWELIEVPK